MAQRALAPEVLGAGSPAQQLRRLGLRPSRRLSQSFLYQPAIARAMVRAGEVGRPDTVVEIGPGLGVLTRELVAVAGSVICIELDRRLAEALPAALDRPPNLRVVHGDAVTLDLAQVVAEPYVLVASLPYHVAVPMLFRLAFRTPRPTRIVVMLQEEVARRVVARPGSMTYLGAALGTVAAARLVRRVPPGAFYPVPKVRSAIVRLDLSSAARVSVDSLDQFLEFLRAAFTQPRRQIHNSLAQGLGMEPGTVRGLVGRVGFDPTRRPASLSLEEWALLYQALRGGLP